MGGRRTTIHAPTRCTEQIELGPAIHLTFHKLEFGVLPLGLSIRPRLAKGRLHRGTIFDDASCEGGQQAETCIRDPGLQIGAGTAAKLGVMRLWPLSDKDCWLAGSLSGARAESTITDRATNLKEHRHRVATIASAGICSSDYQEIGRSVGDRGSNSEPGTVPRGIIDQPVALAGQIAPCFGRLVYPSLNRLAAIGDGSLCLVTHVLVLSSGCADRRPLANNAVLVRAANLCRQVTFADRRPTTKGDSR
jgi:hypothetical protein